MEDLREMRGFFIMIRVCIHPSYMPTGLQKDSPKVFADFNDDEVMEVRSFSGEDLFLFLIFDTAIFISLFIIVLLLSSGLSGPPSSREGGCCGIFGVPAGKPFTLTPSKAHP